MSCIQPNQSAIYLLSFQTIAKFVINIIDSEVNQIDIKFIDTSVNNSKLIVKDRGTI